MLTGCFQSADTSPLVPTAVGSGQDVAQNPTEVPQPTVEQVNPTPEGGDGAPTAIPPTEVPRADTPVVAPPTEVPPVNANPPTEIPPTEIQPTAEQPTAIPPTEVAPTPIPPTPEQPTAIPPTAIPTTAIPPTAAGQVNRPPAEGAMGTIDAQCNYTVEQDDRLIRIGLRFNRTIEQIAAANPTITNIQLIYVGQVLKIPNCTAP